MRSLETPEDVHQTSMYRTSMGFNVSSNVANQFIRLLNNSNRRKARKFKDADLLYEYQTMSMAKPLQNKNLFHNEALLMHQTTTADFEPLQYEIEPRVNTVQIKIQDIPIKKANLDLSFRNHIKRSDRASKRHSSNFSIHSGLGSPRFNKMVESKDSLTVMGDNVQGEMGMEQTLLLQDQMPTSKPVNTVRNVFSKVASSVNRIKGESDPEINLGVISRSMEEKGLSPNSNDTP